MSPGLYGRDPLLRGLLPRLTGLETGPKPRLERQEHPGDHPVVLTVGGHGSGKTAVLDAVAQAYGGSLPLARVDLAGLSPFAAPAPFAAPVPFDARWPEQDPAADPYAALSNTSGVVEVLERLAVQLAAPVPGYRRVRFPRLLPGLFAVSSWRRGHGEQRSLAAARFGRLLPLADGGDAENGDEWAARISARLAGAAAESDVEPVADQVVREYAERHTGGKERAALQDWYARCAPGQPQSDPLSPLVRLCLDFHQGGDLQAPVEQTLVAAFLDDLAEMWSGWWMRVNRKPRPLALLDDAHTAAGRAFLDRVLEHRTRGADDPLVVLATHLGGAGESYPDASRTELGELSHGSGWDRHAHDRTDRPSAGALLVELPPLSPGDVRAMLQRTPKPVHARLQTVLYRLTGGHPQGSALLCDAVVGASAGRDVEPRELLDLETEDGTPAGELLVQRLLPELPLRHHLMVLSLARDRDAAEVLATGAVLTTDPSATGADGGADAERARVAEAARHLERERWTPDPESPDGAAPSFVAHPFLHALLVHEVRRGSPQAEPGRQWDDLHALLRGHHEERGPEGEADALRHMLAGGDAWGVTERLARAFAERDDARAWLALLRHLATAPHPPAAPYGEWRDERVETARGTLDHRHPGADGVQRSVHRLLHALWYLDDPVREPLGELCVGLHKEFAFLAPRHSTGFTVLDAAAGAWAAAARESRRPYPVEGLDRPEC